MNDVPQLIIFEPLKKPRTVTLNVNEDINVAPPVIFDENGHKVTNYKVLYDESQSSVYPKEDIVAYIKNWESQGNVIDEKQARKIAKRKRNQEKKKATKERNKKRKATMKSLIHCNFDGSPLANTSVEEERAILKAMKTQKHSIKSILNIKPNRIINCNTNVRPYENSTIEIGTKKTPIDVVVLDSDEESDSNDDNLQINIDPPQPISTSKRRTTTVAGGGTFRNQNQSVGPASNARKRRNEKAEIVQIDDSSDSDVECVSCEEFIQSLSDDDDDENNTSIAKKKTRLSDNNLVNQCTANSEDLNCVPMDEEASEELVSMVNSFCSKFFQSEIVPLSEIASLTDSEFPVSQIAIMEPFSLQSNPPSAPVESEKNSETMSQLMITEPVSLRPSSLPTRNESKDSNRQVTFNNVVDEKTVNDGELAIVENDTVRPDSHGSDADAEADSESELENTDDSNESEEVSENDSVPNTNVLEYDSIPSPDYTPTENIPATASNLKAFAEFMRKQQAQNSAKDDESAYDSPTEIEDVTPVSTTKSTHKSNNFHQTPSKCDPPSSKNHQLHPWQKHSSKESDETQVIETPQGNHVQSTRPWQKSRNHKNNEIEVLENPVDTGQPTRPWQKSRKHKDDETEVFESPVDTGRPCKPWQKRRNDNSDEIQDVKLSNAVRNQPSCFQKTPPASVITRPDRASQVDCDNVEPSSFPNQKLQSRPGQKSVSLPRGDNSRGNQSQRPNRPSTVNKQSWANRRPAVFNRPSDCTADGPKNSAVEFFDKKSIRIGESRYQARNFVGNKGLVKEESYDEPVASSGRKYYPKNFRNEASNQPYQNRTNPSRRPFGNRFHQQRDRQYGTMSIYEEEGAPEHDQTTETEVDDEMCIDINNERPYEDHPQPYKEAQYVHKFNRYHPEPYEENKYTPESGQQFDNRRVPWCNQNRGRFQHPDQFRRNNQYNNRWMGHNNNFNQNNRVPPRFLPNQGQRLDPYPPNRRVFRQNTPRYNQRSRGNFQNSYNNQQASYARGNQHQNQCQMAPSSPLNASSVQTNANEEVLFTRRDKLNYKANVEDFDDCNDLKQQPKSSEMDSSYRDRDTNFCQPNYVKSYETNVAKELHSGTNDENTFTWENNQSCDFVPINANEPVASPAPWSNTNNNSNTNYKINAISRRQYINDSISSKM